MKRTSQHQREAYHRGKRLEALEFGFSISYERHVNGRKLRYVRKDYCNLEGEPVFESYWPYYHKQQVFEHKVSGRHLTPLVAIEKIEDEVIRALLKMMPISQVESMVRHDTSIRVAERDIQSKKRRTS